MINSILSCTNGGWFMIAAGIATYGLMALAGAALVKYLFFENHDSAVTT